MREYLSIREAAILFKLSESTLRSWIKSKRIPAHKMGRIWRLEKQEVLSALDKN